MEPSSLTKDLIQTPAVEARSLNHWTTREVPSLLLIFKRVFTKTLILLPFFSFLCFLHYGSAITFTGDLENA